MTFTLPDPATHTQLYLFVAGALLVLAVARRIPVLRTIVALGGWVAVAGLLVVVLDQRAAVDPYLTRITAALGIEGQRVEGGETRVPLSPNGHFWVRASIDGVERRLLVDTGATVTALSSGTAQAAGLVVEEGTLPVLIGTANGMTRARLSKVGTMRVGNIVARDLSVVVSPGLGNTDVLGMNFLSRLESWRVEGDTLTLTPRAPDGVESGPVN